MIYVSPALHEPLVQGDIFAGLPRIDLSFACLGVLDEDDELVPKSWSDVAAEGKPVRAMVGMRPVCAIVLTQNCDARHSRDITLCEIRPFQEVDAKCRDTKTPKSWASIITQQARLNYKWFYLPPDVTVGFSAKMAADFFSTIRVSRTDLEGFRSCRRGRLNDVACAHFRERIAEFFRRYPYDEWYSLDPEELKAYQSQYPDAAPFAWQKPE